jgi:uncharacterized protein (DUF433 family)
VEFILELLAERWTYEHILKSYPQWTEEDIWAALSHDEGRLRLVPMPE